MVFAPVVLGLVVGGVTLARTFDVPYTQYRLADIGIHPLGKMWTLWGVGVAVNYLCVPPPFQPLVSFGLAAVWCGYISDVIHAPCRIVITDGNIAKFIRGERQWEM